MFRAASTTKGHARISEGEIIITLEKEGSWELGRNLLCIESLWVGMWIDRLDLCPSNLSTVVIVDKDFKMIV
jgi:hypothetical protein